MGTNKEKLKLITHDGSFHADDIFAAAALSLVLEKKGEEFEILRTRDEQIIKIGDYVFDVGGVYDAEKNKFDHHQVGSAGKRPNGIEYASAGLVWKKFGVELCGNTEYVEKIDDKLFAPIDAWDNGFELIENKYKISQYLLQHAFLSMVPTWREGEEKNDEMFFKCVEIAKGFLSREIIQETDADLAQDEVVRAYEKSQDKRIIFLDKQYPYGILNTFPEPLYVIYYKESSKHFMVKAVRDDWKTFVNRKNFPKLWAGLRDGELQNVSGVRDAVFCHRGLFLAVAISKEGAIKLAEIAVES